MLQGILLGIEIIQTDSWTMCSFKNDLVQVSLPPRLGERVLRSTA